MKNIKLAVVAVVAVVVGAISGYSYGSRVGYLSGDTAGYDRSQEDIKKLQAAAAQKAGRDAAKAANPFQAVNPLQGVETNPFEKATKALNPFR